MPKIRLLFTMPDAAAFGAEIGLANTLSALDREAFEPEAVVFREGPFLGQARAQGMRATYLPGLVQATLRNPRALLPGILRLARFIERSGADVVELCWGLQYLPLVGPAAALAGKPYVYRERMHSQKLRLVYRALLGRAAAIMPVTRGTIAAWDDWRWCRPWRRVLEERVHVVPSSRDIESLVAAPLDRAPLRALGVPDGAPVVGMVAALNARKRHELLLRAAPEILRARPDAWFVFVGGPYSDDEANAALYLRALQALADRLGVAERTVFTGYRADAKRLMRGFETLVLPSAREALGAVLIEAQAFGVPPVAADVDGLREVVEHEKTGFLIPGDGSDGYARAITRLLTDAALRARMSLAAVEHARSFDNRRLTLKLEACYRAASAAAGEKKEATSSVAILRSPRPTMK